MAGQCDEKRELIDRISSLERKCAFLTKRLEDVLISATENGIPANINNHCSSCHELSRLRDENERLRRKVAILYNSVSWWVTKPLRWVNIPVIDRWIRSRIQ